MHRKYWMERVGENKKNEEQQREHQGHRRRRSRCSMVEQIFFETCGGSMPEQMNIPDRDCSLRRTHTGAK
jgi:hypothetical protein